MERLGAVKVHAADRRTLEAALVAALHQRLSMGCGEYVC